MRAFKSTGPDGVSVFTRFRWPLPGDGSEGEPGAWVDAADGGSLCERGLHACHAAQLPYWLGPRLWEVELSGEVIESPYKVVAGRARLIRELSAWPELVRPFAQACAHRVGELAAGQLAAAGATDAADAAVAAGAAGAALVVESWQRVAAMAEATAPPLAATLAGYATDCWWDIGQGYYTMCAYVAATAFGCASTGSPDQDMESPGWHQERAAQARWLAGHLDLGAVA